MALLDLTLGALQLTILLSSVLYGFSVGQVLLYNEQKLNDPTWLRVMVVVIWIFDTTHIILLWFYLYSLAVVDYGVPDSLEAIRWNFMICFPVGILIGTLVQVYFTYRVYRLSGSLFVPVLGWSFLLLRCGFAFTIFVLPSIKSIFKMDDFIAHYQWVIVTPLSINVFVDSLYTAASCYHLLRTSSDYKQSKRVVSRLVMFMIETGMLTSLFAIATLCASLFQYELLAFGLFSIYPRIYSNSFLASLNARVGLRRTYGEVQLTNTKHVSQALSIRPLPDIEIGTAIMNFMVSRNSS